MTTPATVYIVMGVSGCGKSTIGARLAKDLALPFHDADDFHPQTNRDKMAAGQPLTDQDRQPWLETLAQHIADCASRSGAVLACSSLKRAYRQTLRQHSNKTIFIFLTGDRDLIHQRMTQRADHYMPPTLLDSQLATLEPPADSTDTEDPAIHLDITPDTDTIMANLHQQLAKEGT
ncbi:gluconokinase [Mucisphaera sp.]|uniref:gluconokinase n=1 Tax=Mucisphaera sp. TaxID=2913024 RepID=UPI003D1101D2